MTEASPSRADNDIRCLIKEAAQKFGLRERSIRYRIKNMNWSVEKAISTPRCIISERSDMLRIEKLFGIKYHNQYKRLYYDKYCKKEKAPVIQKDFNGLCGGLKCYVLNTANKDKGEKKYNVVVTGGDELHTDNRDKFFMFLEDVV
jgi:hypothetical protein